MRSLTLTLCLFGVLASAGCASTATTDNAVAAEPASEPDSAFVRDSDLIYSKQGGFALTLDRIAPSENANGAGVVMVVSGGWFSSHEQTQAPAGQLPEFFQANAAELLSRGYTLFYVVHGSQPKFTIREIDTQLSAAVQHVRYHAADFGIDPDRIGIMGGSAGGHLSLMRGTTGVDGGAAPAAPTETGSRVQAVVAYFPPTDFLNYGNEGVFFDTVVREVIPEGRNPFLQATDYWEFDPVEIRLNKVTDADRLTEHYQKISPYNHVSADDAPTLLLHGNVDRLVPLQQSELIARRFAQEGVAHSLYVKDGGDHGWEITAEEAAMVADWFDQHL